LNTLTPAKAEPEAPGAGPEEEQQQRMDYETLEKMPLESLLYYVLVGEGRKRSEAASKCAGVCVLGN
jgi:hypothetical protein